MKTMRPRLQEGGGGGVGEGVKRGGGRGGGGGGVAEDAYRRGPLEKLVAKNERTPTPTQKRR